jgi:hypothetical protein
LPPPPLFSEHYYYYYYYYYLSSSLFCSSNIFFNFVWFTFLSPQQTLSYSCFSSSSLFPRSLFCPYVRRQISLLFLMKTRPTMSSMYNPIITILIIIIVLSHGAERFLRI